MCDYVIELILLGGLVLSALWAVLSPRLLRSVLALALASIMVTLLLFRLRSPLAGVFELSVCAGLISAVFLSVISMTQPDTETSVNKENRERLRRYWYLPVILVLVGLALCRLELPNFPLAEEIGGSVRDVLWNVRQLDLLGQIVILLAGAFGVVVLFKEWRNER